MINQYYSFAKVGFVGMRRFNGAGVAVVIFSCQFHQPRDRIYNTWIKGCCICVRMEWILSQIHYSLFPFPNLPLLLVHSLLSRVLLSARFLSRITSHYSTTNEMHCGQIEKLFIHIVRYYCNICHFNYRVYSM